MKLGEKIKKIRLEKKMTMQQLADKAGKSKGYISMIEKGKNPQTNKPIEPSLEAIQKIAKALNVELDFLITDTSDVVKLPKLKTNKFTPTSQGIKIPVLGTVPAGIPITAVEDILDYEEIPQSWSNQGEFFALQIKGGSMEPRMESGDVVIVRQQPDADSGDIVIALVNGDDATCKKLEKTDSGIMLVSTNPKYPPMYYSFEDIETLPVTILGKVVEFRGKF